MRCLILALSYASAALAASGEPTTWEDQRRAQSEQDKENFTQLIEVRRDRLIASLPPIQRRQLQGIEINVRTDIEATFVCRSLIDFDDNGNRRRRLEMSVETIATIFKVAGASALTTIDSSLGDKWLRNYLLYLRKTPDGSVIVDPLRASGYLTQANTIRDGIRAETLVEYKRRTVDIAESMLMFLIAHELGHFASWPTPRRERESESDFSSRLRMSEAHADKFGVELLLAMERATAGQGFNRPPFFAKGAPILFLWWVLAMEGTRHPVAPGTHPLDHSRALATSALIISKIDTLGLTTKEREQILRASEELRSEMAQVKEKGPGFFAVLDEDAALVTAETLMK